MESNWEKPMNQAELKVRLYSATVARSLANLREKAKLSLSLCT